MARQVPPRLRPAPKLDAVNSRVLALVLPLVGALALSGCSTTAVAGTPSPTASVPSASASVASAEPTAQVTAEPAAEPTPVTPTPVSKPAPAPDTRSGKALNEPFTVDGIVVVSKVHRLSSSYVPAWASKPHGLHPDVHAAFQELAAAAKADGAPVSIRSGYRSYAAQQASFAKAKKQYDDKSARLYFAEAGASEHQTGLALDAWDGRNRGTAFARTEQASWLAAHAHEYGFIVRYPQGKTDITGYAWESWHLRWVGTEIAAEFGPNSSLTLEEYLGLA